MEHPVTMWQSPVSTYRRVPPREVPPQEVAQEVAQEVPQKVPPWHSTCGMVGTSRASEYIHEPWAIGHLAIVTARRPRRHRRAQAERCRQAQTKEIHSVHDFIKETSAWLLPAVLPPMLSLAVTRMAHTIHRYYAATPEDMWPDAGVDCVGGGACMPASGAAPSGLPPP